MKKCIHNISGKCRVFNGIVIKDDKCRCPLYMSEEIKCDKCGQIIVQSPIAVNVDGSWKFYCENCVRSI